MRTHRKAAVLFCLCFALSSGAVEKGGTLYVTARNTRLLKTLGASSNVVAVLQVGQAVIWLGPDPSDPRWHRVRLKDKEGVVFQTSLGTHPPQIELTASAPRPGGSAQAFASS